MKKILALSLAVCLLLGSLAACALAEEPSVDAMLPVLDSVLLGMVDGGERPFAPNDRAYFWKALGLLSVNWSMDNPLCERTDTHLKVPRKLMEAYAAALCASGDLPETPAECFVQYDAGTDMYLVGLGDRGDSYSAITGCEKKADGTLVVTVELRGSEQEAALYTMRATLVANAYAGDITDPMYPYAVQTAEMAA